MIDKLKSIWKVAVVVYWMYEYYAGNCLKGVRKITKFPVRIIGDLNEIITEYFPNPSLVLSSYTGLFGLKVVGIISLWLAPAQ